MGSLSSTTLQFGAFVNVPVSVLSAAESPESLKTLCTDHNPPVPIIAPRLCSITHEPPPEGKTGKGRQVGKNQYVLLSADEQAEVAEVADDFQTIALEVHDRKTVLADTFPAGTCYWLSPKDQTAGAGYVTLARLIAKAPAKAFLARFAVRGAVSLFLVEVRGGALFLQRLEWPDAVREAPAVPEGTVDKATMAASLTMAGQLMAALEGTVAWSREGYGDPRRQARDKLLAGRQVVSGDQAAVALPAAGDLRAALAASMAAVAPAKTPRRRPAKAAKPDRKAS